MKKFYFVLFFFGVFSFLFAKELKIGQALEPPHLDPTIGAAGAIDEILYNNVFEGLITLDANGEVQPLLAKSWLVSVDKKSYTFELERDVFFHDGKEFSAEDVVFSLERIIAKDSVNAQKKLYQPIQKIFALSKYQVQIQLKFPYTKFLYYLAWGDAVIINSKNFKSNKSFPIGTGPFRFEKWIRGNRLELVKNTDYWGKKNTIEKVVFLFISDPATAFHSLLAGEIDGYPNFPAPENVPLFAQNNNFIVVLGNTEGETLLAMNHQKTPLQNLKVRQAIQHAVNKEEIIQGAMYGYAEPIGSHFSPNHKDYLDLSSFYDYNINKAKKLLKEAGYPDGFEATLKLPPPYYARRSGEILVQQLNKIGIKLKIINVEWARWLSEVFQEKKYDFTIIAHTEPYDFSIYAREDYYFNYQSPVFTQKLKNLNSTFEEKKRQDLHRQLMKILTEDSVNVFLFQLPKIGIWKKNISGFWKDSPIQANVIRDIQIN